MELTNKTPESVKEYVENSDLVQVKTFDKFEGLKMLKYKRKVFYKNLWDDYLVDFRGTVVSEDFIPIALPFRKIFNRKENGVDIQSDAKVVAVDKINGYMVAMTYVPEVDKVLVSTTGSLDSEHVNMAHDFITADLLGNIKLMFLSTQVLCTWVFECCHKDDPHIIPEDEGLYLLGGREVIWDGEEIHDQEFLDQVGRRLGVKRPDWKEARFSDIIESMNDYKREGYVVYDTESEAVLKLKSPHYLTSKFLARAKEDKLLEGDLQDLIKAKGNLDEEFFPLIDYIKSTGVAEFTALKEQERLEFIREFFKKSNTEN